MGVGRDAGDGSAHGTERRRAVSEFFGPNEWFVSRPLAELGIFALGILLLDYWFRRWRPGLTPLLALLGIGFAAIPTRQIQLAVRQAPLQAFDGALRVDNFAVYFWFLFLAAAGVAVLTSYRFLEIEEEPQGEYYALLLFSVIGMFVLAAADELIVAFLGLEVMSLALYVLVGYLLRDRRSNEAALKYLLLGAFSSAILAYGMSLLYGLSGSTRFEEVAAALARQSTAQPLVFLGVAALTVGLLFKLAAAPFHQWAPDAYQGAPTALVGFMSVGVKAAAFALLLRLFQTALPAQRPGWAPMLAGVALATMTLGNFGALLQNNTKRLLAYSSIAHAGYMLLGFVAGNQTGRYGVLVYLLVYTFMELGAFTVLVSLRRRGIVGDRVDDLNGLMHKAPGSAIMMLLFLLSLAGVPPLAGFYGKYFIFLALIQTQHFALAVAAVLYVALSLYYYVRLVAAMFTGTATESAPLSYSAGLRLALGALVALTVLVGVFPEPMLRMAHNALIGW